MEGLTHERFIVATEYIHWSKLLPTATLDIDTPALPCLQVFSTSLALQPYSSHLLLPQFPEGQAAHIKPAAVTRTSLEKPLLPGKWPMKLCRHPKMLWKTERARHSLRGVLRWWRRRINTNMQSKDFGQTHHTAWKRSHCNSCHATCCLETYHNKVAVQSFSLKLIFEEQVFLCSFSFFFSPSHRGILTGFRSLKLQGKKPPWVKEGMGKAPLITQVVVKGDLHLGQLPINLQQLLLEMPHFALDSFVVWAQLGATSPLLDDHFPPLTCTGCCILHFETNS